MNQVGGVYMPVFNSAGHEAADGRLRGAIDIVIVLSEPRKERCAGDIVIRRIQR